MKEFEEGYRGSTLSVYFIIYNNQRFNVRRNIRFDHYPEILPLRNPTNPNNNHHPIPKPHKNSLPNPNLLPADDVHLHQAPLPLKKSIPLLRIIAQQH